MRKIVLTANDFEMFDTEIGSVEFEFFHKHKDAFKRMWREQGRKFWIQFVMSYRQYAVDYGTIKEFPAKNEHFEDFVDQAFIVVHDNFVEGKFGLARSFITDIVLVAQNRHALQYLEAKSYAKDPFYNKETRDVFRRLFGPPNEKSSYLKVYILFPIYMKYAGAVCKCLRRWLDADDIPSVEENNPDISSCTDQKHKQEDKPPAETKSDSSTGSRSSSSNRVSPTLDTEEQIYATLSCPGPHIIELDEEKDDQRKEKEEKGDNKPPSQINDVSLKGLKSISDGCGDYQELALLNDSDEMDEMESLYEDGPHRMRKEMMRRQMMMEERRMEFFPENDHEYFKMYIDEVKHGSKRGPLFVKGWPRGTDPRITDPDNPIYDPTNSRADWKDGLRLPNFAKFVKYVKENYKRGVKLTADEKSQRKRMKDLEEMRDNQMEENINRTLSSKKLGVKSEAFALKLEDHKLKESQEERKRKKKLKKKVKKGLPVSSSELALLRGVSSQNRPVAALLSEALAEPIPDDIKSGLQCPTCYNAMLKNPKTGGSRCSNIKCSLPLEGPSGGFQLAPGLSSIQVDLEDYSFKIEKPTKPDPRKPYRLDEKNSPPKYVEPKRVEHRKDMDMVAPPEIEPNSVKLIKKVDEEKGTVTLTIEKRDGQGNTTTETTIKPLNGGGDKKIWEEALSKLNPIGSSSTAPPVLNESVQRDILSKMSTHKMLEAGPSDHSSSSCGSKALVSSKTNSSSGQTGPPEEMGEEDKKQFRDMYKEISSAIGEVSRYTPGEDEPKGYHAMCHHESRHEKARNRLRRKLGERKPDRKHPELPGLVRLGGQIEYPEDENEAMMLTLAEMTKMNPKEKELFQEKLGRTKYFKDQDDPRDVVDHMNQCLFPGIRDTLKDEKAKSKKAKIREQEKLDIEKMKRMQAEIREERDMMKLEELSSRLMLDSASDVVKERKDTATRSTTSSSPVRKDLVSSTDRNNSLSGTETKDLANGTNTNLVKERKDSSSGSGHSSSSSRVKDTQDLVSGRGSKDAVSTNSSCLVKERNDLSNGAETKDSASRTCTSPMKRRQDSAGRKTYSPVKERRDLVNGTASKVSGSKEKKESSVGKHDLDDLAEKVAQTSQTPVQVITNHEGYNIVIVNSNTPNVSRAERMALLKAVFHENDMEKSDTDSDDLKRVMEYKDDVKRMKEGLQFNSKKMARLMDSQRHHDKDSCKTSREISLRVHDANRELRRIDEKINILDRECENLEDTDLTKNVQRASDELRRVKSKVRQWEDDAEVLTKTLQKIENDRTWGLSKTLQRFENETGVLGSLLEDSGMTKDELLADEKVRKLLKKNAADIYDTHPPDHPEVTEEILERSKNRDIDQKKVLQDLADIIGDEVILGGHAKKHNEEISGKGASKGNGAQYGEPGSDGVEEEASNKFADSLFSADVSPSPPTTKPASVVSVEQKMKEPVTEVTEQKPKAETAVAKPSKKVRPGQGPETIQRVSYKLSHPVGGRVADNRSPQQKLKDSEMYPDMSTTLTSPEKKAKARDVKKSSKDKGSSKSLKVCSGCGNTEPSPKAFKKCQKCKENQIKNSRYYCGKECQGDDWRKRHKMEHKEKRLE